MRNLRWVTGAVLVVAGTLTITGAPAHAAPAPYAVGPAGTVTMVNGVGRTITIPRSLAAVHSSSSAGAAPVVHPDTIIGRDDRVQETDTTSFPARAIVYIVIGTSWCTGFLVSRDVVVTAAHCIQDVFIAPHKLGPYRVVPGKNGTAEPFGSCSGNGLEDAWVSDAWIAPGTIGQPDYDYGLIKLRCDIGDTVGWFGTWQNTAETLTGQAFSVEGYPQDKPSATMWRDSDPITSQSATRLRYLIDTMGGQSGSPIYRMNSTTPGLCSGWCVTGIHAYQASTDNAGTRFNPDVMSFINFWISQP